MIPDDLEDLKDRIEELECKLVALVKKERPNITFHAMVRIISTILVFELENKEEAEQKFQRTCREICVLCKNLAREYERR